MTYNPINAVLRSGEFTALGVSDNGTVVATESNNRLSYSTNHGASFAWSNLNWLYETLGFSRANDGSNDIYASSNNYNDGTRRIYKSTDNGANWTSHETISFSLGFGMAISSSGDIYVAQNASGVLKKQASGRSTPANSWTTVAGTPAGYAQCPQIISSDGVEYLYVSNGSGYIYRKNITDDTDWESVISIPDAYPSMCVSPSTNIIYIWSANGTKKPYCLPWGGSSWVELSTDATGGATGQPAAAGIDGYVYMSGTSSGGGGSVFRQYTEPPAASGPANLKSLNGNAKSNIKSINGNLLANIKSLSGNT